MVKLNKFTRELKAIEDLNMQGIADILNIEPTDEEIENERLGRSQVKIPKATEDDPDYLNDPDFQGYTEDEFGNKIKSHPSQYTQSGWDWEEKERMATRGDVDNDSLERKAIEADIPGLFEYMPIALASWRDFRDSGKKSKDEWMAFTSGKLPEMTADMMFDRFAKGDPSYIGLGEGNFFDVDTEEEEAEYNASVVDVDIPEYQIIEIIKSSNGVTAEQILDQITGTDFNQRMRASPPTDYHMNLANIESQGKIRREGSTWYASESIAYEMDRICPDCGGSGMTYGDKDPFEDDDYLESEFGRNVNPETYTCPTCGGLGKIEIPDSQIYDFNIESREFLTDEELEAEKAHDSMLEDKRFLDALQDVGTDPNRKMINATTDQDVSQDPSIGAVWQQDGESEGEDEPEYHDDSIIPADGKEYDVKLETEEEPNPQQEPQQEPQQNLDEPSQEPEVGGSTGDIWTCPDCGFKTINKDEADAHGATHRVDTNVPADVETPITEAKYVLLDEV